jgi:hypothetical protein
LPSVGNRREAEVPQQQSEARGVDRIGGAHAAPAQSVAFVRIS